jgi:hypothetical protein
MDEVDNPFPDATQEYYPLRVGNSITYQVDSIVFDDAPGGNSKDTISFQLKEEIADAGVNAQGDTIYYIHRYRRAADPEPWSLTDVWTTSKNSAEALRTEENLTFNKLSFPLRFGKRWYSTEYIHPQTSIQVGTENLKPYQEWEAEILSFDRAGVVGTFSFPEGQVMVMHQADQDDGIMRRYVQETYVRHIGMVYRYDEILDSRCIDLGDFGPCIGKTWVEHASKGYILSQVMIDYR